MKSIVAFLIVLFASTAHAAPATRLRVIPQLASGLTIEITEAPSGAPLLGVTPQQRVLDLGLLASFGAGTPAPNVTITQTGDRIIASTEFVLKVTGTSVTGSAHILGSVTGIDPAYVIRIDGIPLTSAPIVVRAACRSRDFVDSSNGHRDSDCHSGNAAAPERRLSGHSRLRLP